MVKTISCTESILCYKHSKKYSSRDTIPLNILARKKILGRDVADRGRKHGGKSKTAEFFDKDAFTEHEGNTEDEITGTSSIMRNLRISS
jgi:hypothetical protein